MGLHLAANAYVGWHFHRLLRPRGRGRLLFWAFFAFFLLAYPLARLPESVLPPRVAAFLVVPGSWWFGFIWYFGLIFILCDLLRLPAFLLKIRFRLDLARGRFLASVLAASVILIMGLGWVNASRLAVTPVEVEVPGAGGPLQEVRIGVISDIHLGTLDGRQALERIGRIFRELKPDLLVFLGDIVDRHHPGMDLAAHTAPLRDLSAPLGKFAILGNHEYLSGVEEALDFFRLSGIRVLRDEAVEVGESFYLAGRDDWSRTWQGSPSLPLAEVTSGIPAGWPVVVLDHQPLGRRVVEAARAGADLQLSGHIHAGQLWPFGWIVRIFFPYLYGLYRVEGMPLWVTSGAGCWGPPVRIGNRPEVLLLTLKFRGKTAD